VPQLKVLVVDADLAFAEMEKAALERDGSMTVSIVQSTEGAVDEFVEDDFDIVVSAFQMQGTNGIHLLRSLRNRGIDVPFILLTGKGSEETAMQALNEGADFYLRKDDASDALFVGLAHKIRRAVERNYARKDLQDNENRLRRAESVARSGNWVIYLKKGTIAGSPGAMELYGLDTPVVPLATAQKMVLPEYRETLDEALRDLIKNGKPYDVHFRVKRAIDGQILDLHSRAEYDEEKQAVFGVVHDITQQVRALEAAREAQTRLRIAMDLAKLAQWEYDVSSDTFTFDDQFYTLFATTSEREGGTKMRSKVYAESFLPADQNDLVGREIAKSLTTTDPNSTTRIEHDIIRRDGERRTIVALVRVNIGPDGKVFRTYGANQDITEMKNVERSLSRAMTKLELLTSITRHDFANQITVVQGNLELLGRHLTDPKDLGRIAKMKAGVEEINKRFQFLKEYRPGNDTPIWHDLEIMFAGLPIAKSVDELGLGEGLRNLEILADPMLNIVFHNLLEDSVKYAKKPVKVKIDAVQNDGELLIVYEDEGPGIAPQRKEEIFTKGETRQHLGLFLSKHVLLGSGITIREVGTPGEGVRFEMAVPKGRFRYTM
jgi:CheY-like chemotaxis protein/two-component sensor histidine kinase